jgi:hypothetical protein
MVQESPGVWFRNSPATEASAAKGHIDSAPWSAASSARTALPSESSVGDLSVNSSSSVISSSRDNALSTQQIDLVLNSSCSSSSSSRDNALATHISLISLPMFEHEKEEPLDFPAQIEHSHSHEYSQSYSQHLRRTQEMTDFADRLTSRGISIKRIRSWFMGTERCLMRLNTDTNTLLWGLRAVHMSKVDAVLRAPKAKLTLILSVHLMGTGSRVHFQLNSEQEAVQLEAVLATLAAYAAT